MTQTTQETNFRDYSNAKDSVVQFYKQNHECQTLEFVLEKKKEYAQLNMTEMGIWYVSAG